MRGGERGYASILVLGFTLVAIGAAAIAIDGTRAFLYRRSLQNAADAAALAGAAELDRQTYYTSKGRRVALDPVAAEARARAWLARRGLPLDASIQADHGAVRVVVKGTVETTFLRVLGLRAVPVAADSLARPIVGSP